MKRRLILLRHGDIGHEGQYIGATDVLLSEVGKSQIRKLVGSIGRINPELILCSPMQRCLQCGEILFAEPARIQQESALREVDFGRWEGLSFEEIKEQDPALVTEWASGRDSFRFPEGERIKDFHERVQAMGERVMQAREGSILLITHGGVIRTLICSLLKLPLENSLLFRVDRGRVATLDLFAEDAVLSGLNLGGAQWAD